MFKPTRLIVALIVTLVCCFAVSSLSTARAAESRPAWQ